MSQNALKQALERTIGVVSNDPAKARLLFRTRSRLLDGVRCSAEVRDFPPIVVDEPAELGGSNAGPNPVELVWSPSRPARNMYAAYAVLALKPGQRQRGTRRPWAVGLDESVPAGYRKVSFETVIKSPADLARWDQCTRGSTARYWTP